MIRIVHVITGLSTGGAEMMLFKLLSRMDRSRFDHAVISLTDCGPVGVRIQKELSIPVRTVGLRLAPDSLLRLPRLISRIREFKPDLVQTWMYHGDVLGGLAARALKIPVAWNVRQSNLAPELNGRTTLLFARLSARLSRFVPAAIVCGSEAAARTHAQIGYSAERMIVLHNGFDLDAFAPNPAGRSKVRAELGLGREQPVVALVARFDPQKDHRTFVRAAERLGQQIPDVAFVLCGRGISNENRVLTEWLESAGITDRTLLLGERGDIPDVLNAADVFMLSSRGEGFPNVVGEAMACGVPCVVTDVGDSALVVGDRGRVVPPENPERLAQACSELLRLSALERRELSAGAVERIRTHFDIRAVAERYAAFYAALASGRAPGRADT